MDPSRGKYTVDVQILSKSDDFKFKYNVKLAERKKKEYFRQEFLDFGLGAVTVIKPIPFPMSCFRSGVNIYFEKPQMKTCALFAIFFFENVTPIFSNARCAPPTQNYFSFFETKINCLYKKKVAIAAFGPCVALVCPSAGPSARPLSFALFLPSLPTSRSDHDRAGIVVSERRSPTPTK